MMRRVAITGWGVASPLGNTRAEFAAALREGRSGAHPITTFDASGFASRIAATVTLGSLTESCPGWAVEEFRPSGDRKLELGLVAAHAALEQAGLLTTRGEVGGISLGTGLSSLLAEEVEIELLPYLDPAGQFDHQAFAQGVRAAERFVPRHLPGRTTGWLTEQLGINGPATTHFSACAASAHAIGQAAHWVARGAADRVLAGGMDSMVHPFGLASFVLLGTLTTRNDEPARASRPFDLARDGFLLGEGAAMLLVESFESARARGVPILAEVLGSGSSLDAWQVTAPHPTGQGAVLAMQRALRDAGIQPAQVSYVNAHGTATRLNDPVEIQAFRRVFGPAADRCPISSTKSMHGHLIAGAGAIEACAAIVAILEQFLPPTINLDQLDPECQADVVPNRSRVAPVEIVLSNSFGFGGQNGVLILARYPR